MARNSYYQTTKFKVGLVYTFLLLAATAVLLYFTVTNCVQQCSNEQVYTHSCIDGGTSFCCPSTNIKGCKGCIEENHYCQQFIIGSGACFLLAVVAGIYLCIIRKVHLKNAQRSTWSAGASLATMKEQQDHSSSLRGTQRNINKTNYQPPRIR